MNLLAVYRAIRRHAAWEIEPMPPEWELVADPVTLADLTAARCRLADGPTPQP